MTDLTQAARQALPLLERDCTSLLACHQDPATGAIPAEEPEVVAMYDEYVAAIAALRAALEAQQEPVAWEHESGLLMYQTEAGHYAPGKLRDRGWRPLYAAPQPQGWVPVTQKMPKSGQAVLACYRNHLGKLRRIRAEWIAAKSVEAINDESDIGEYDEATDTYYYPEGWYERIDNWGDYSSVAVTEGEVTHWQPLPEPPKEPQA